MSHYVLKASRDHDMYAVYSDNTDAVMFVGTRAAMRRYLIAEAGSPLEASNVDGRLDRTDERGSSCYMGTRTGGVLYGWDDDEIGLAAGPGAPGDLPRKDLYAYCLAFAADDEAAAAALVRPAAYED